MEFYGVKNEDGKEGKESSVGSLRGVHHFESGNDTVIPRHHGDDGGESL